MTHGIVCGVKIRRIAKGMEDEEEEKDVEDGEDPPTVVVDFQVPPMTAR